jgi:hypothetical protein
MIPKPIGRPGRTLYDTDQITLGGVPPQITLGGVPPQITPNEAHVLEYLGQRPHTTAVLAALLRQEGPLNMSSVTLALRRLEKRGLVTRSLVGFTTKKTLWTRVIATRVAVSA